MNTSESFLSTHEITKSFGGVQALAGVSLTIARGESVAIMGPSGSGKTTLLNCMSGVLLPDAGQVRMGEHVVSDLADADRSHLRLQECGFVFQDGQLIPELKAVENVALPLMLTGHRRGESMKRAREVLGRLGMLQLADRYPGMMSGGQMQRVAIARALVGSPSVIFADEPTGALDQATGHEVMQMLTATARVTNASLVLVTHDTSVASWCGRLIEIRDGLLHVDRRLNAEEA